MIISFVIGTGDAPKRFKAPRGFMYEIWDIHFMVFTAGAGILTIVNYLLEDEVTTISVRRSEGILASFSSTIAGQAEDFTFTKGEKTKFITGARDGSNTMGVIAIIHYELIKASRTELLLEWFRKGR